MTPPSKDVEKGEGFNKPVTVKSPHIIIRILNQLSALMGRKNEHFEINVTQASGEVLDAYGNPRYPAVYQQSATRKLAFGGLPTTSFATIQDEKKAKNLGEFYNNSTLTLIAKIFSVCVILCALAMLIREAFYNS
ncbi:unnamed protein product [Bursaphelenchus okinawaensis]|uniref:Uncharacterized protein n=1 Tax=Bursaphelenchus okinawaensis TaxID=465554 RepID=A0A811JVA7_9BILA|nr:unnamed protein product [Bursaphelenchus okinawaensis]CAG9084199.1 unnamed protein product [Bursaphelenchus okinawaensis]